MLHKIELPGIEPKTSRFQSSTLSQPSHSKPTKSHDTQRPSSFFFEIEPYFTFDAAGIYSRKPSAREFRVREKAVRKILLLHFSIWGNIALAPWLVWTTSNYSRRIRTHAWLSKVPLFFLPSFLPRPLARSLGSISLVSSTSNLTFKHGAERFSETFYRRDNLVFKEKTVKRFLSEDSPGWEDIVYSSKHGSVAGVVAWSC